MYDGIKTAVLSGGVNHIDTAPNYRYKKSEKTVGRILTTLDNKYGVARNQMFVTSKAGYLAEDAELMISRNDELKRLVTEVKVPDEEISKEQMHSMHPLFLKDQLDGSLGRLNLDTLDVYYLQNAYEAQGPYNTDNVFFDRLAKSFEFLESQVAEGKIRNFGLATYSCFRVKPAE